MDAHQLEKYSFWWTEARLVVAAIALLMGGVPPIYLISPPALFGIARTGLILAWIISGAVSLYLLYRWNDNRQKVFGGKDSKDIVAFFVAVVTGVNLGLAGILGRNIGMTISSNRVVFLIVAVIYLVTAYYLFTRWNKNGKKIF